MKVELKRFWLSGCAVVLVFLMGPSGGFAQDKLSPERKSRAFRIWESLNGTAPSSTFVGGLGPDLSDAAIAKLAMQDPQSTWITAKLRSLATRRAARDSSIGTPPGDFVLSWMFSAEKSLEALLTEDFRYPGDASTVNLLINQSDVLREKSTRTVVKQDYISDVDRRLGLLTTQQYGESIFSGGTNRRPVKKILDDFLCTTLEQFSNRSLPESWIGQDISRNSNEDKKKNHMNSFGTSCVGCHSGMDAMRGAFIQYDFSNLSLRYVLRVPSKVNRERKTFPEGHFVRDETWQDFLLSENDQNTYSGPKPLIQKILNSPWLYQCLTKRTHEVLCPDVDLSHRDVKEIGSSLNRKSNMSHIFEAVTTRVCLKDMSAPMKQVRTDVELIALLESRLPGVGIARRNFSLRAQLPQSSEVPNLKKGSLSAWYQLSLLECDGWFKKGGAQKPDSVATVLKQVYQRDPEPREVQAANLIMSDAMTPRSSGTGSKRSPGELQHKAHALVCANAFLSQDILMKGTIK